ncbi:MAG: hypothetical protein J6Z17_00455 [Treponema sp.]|nr:hypothetical protein [Treponema sp.]
MKKSIFFAAGFAALAMLFVACDDGDSKKPGSEPPAPPPVIPGWEKVLKIDTDPEAFVAGTQNKFQFKITGLSYPEGSTISFYFVPCKDFDGSVCFRDSGADVKMVNSAVPTEIGQTVETGATGTVTKTDANWYYVEMKAAAAGTQLGFTWYKTALPLGEDVVYLKGFKVSYIDSDTDEPSEYEYTLEDFTFDAETNPTPCKIEPYYSVEGLRVTEVDSF